MKVLVIGSGGREHAIVWKIAQSAKTREIYAAPGNPGMIGLATCVPISATDTSKLLAFALEKKIDLVVVGPEAPLVAGITDLFESKHIPVFGPSQKAARLEGSKSFSKEIMRRHGIPTAAFRVFDNYSAARDYIEHTPAPMVVKADGLAAGKGVVVAKTQEEALAALDAMMKERKFGDAGDVVVVEECLEGEEVSLLALTDGKTLIPLETAQDHKRVFDLDEGPNTGGMGAYSPVKSVGADLLLKIERTILIPTLHAMNSEGAPYKGVLYAGLMLTNDGPRVLEYNVRFGDPETQAILMRLKSDLGSLL
jgi:phosphoribosylamine---glycine ligase